MLIILLSEKPGKIIYINFIIKFAEKSLFVPEEKEEQNFTRV